MADYDTGWGATFDLGNIGDGLTYNQNTANLKYDQFNTKYGLNSDAFDYNKLTPVQKANYNADLSALNTEASNVNMGGLGGTLFGKDGFSMQGLGNVASGLNSVLGLAGTLQGLFGGPSDLEKAQLNYLNQTSSGLADQLAEQNKRNTEFRADRDRITKSYMS